MKQTTGRPFGYWKVWQNVESEILPHVINGKFPTLNMLKQGIGSRIANAVADFGGINEVARRMGFEPPNFYVASDGHYVNSGYEYLLDEFLWSRGIPHFVNGQVPGSNYLYDFKVGEYYIEIWGYEERPASKRCARYSDRRKAKEAFYSTSGLPLISIEHTIFKQPLMDIEVYFEDLFDKLGFDISLKEAKYTIENSAKHCRFWNEEKIIEELKVFVAATGNFPSKNVMEKLNAGLADAITRHKGFHYFREKLGVASLQKRHGTWNEHSITQEISTAMKTIGKFPTADDLRKMDRKDLIRAINRFGGFASYQHIFGVQSFKKDWTTEDIVSELRKIAQTLGRQPSYSDARRINKTVVSAIDRSKRGFGFFKDQM